MTRSIRRFNFSAKGQQLHKNQNTPPRSIHEIKQDPAEKKRGAGEALPRIVPVDQQKEIQSKVATFLQVKFSLSSEELEREGLRAFH